MASPSLKALGTELVLEVEGKCATKVVPGAAVKAKPSMMEPPNRLVLETCF